MSDDLVEFVAFGIDPGHASGWAISECPEIPAMLGSAIVIEDRVAACRYVKKFAAGRPIVVVIEDWTIGGSKANYKMFKALGRSAGRWLEQIERILGIKEKYVVRVVQQRWRNDLFTSELVREHKGSENLKRLACAFVSPPGANPIKDHNIAEAGCLACWLHCSEEGADAAESALRRCAKLAK